MISVIWKIEKLHTKILFMVHFLNCIKNYFHFVVKNLNSKNTKKNSKEEDMKIKNK